MDLSFSLPKKVKISSDVLFEKLDGKSVLLHIEKETYYTLDEVGTDMWNLLNEKENIEDVLNILLETYDIDRKTLEYDLNNLIKKLSQSNLLTTE